MIFFQLYIPSCISLWGQDFDRHITIDSEKAIRKLIGKDALGEASPPFNFGFVTLAFQQTSSTFHL